MTYEVIANIEVPAAAGRTRAKGAFGQALDALEVGSGFYFEANGKRENQYAKIAPKKFDGKKFKVWMVEEGIRAATKPDGTPLTNKAGEQVMVSKFGVKRIADTEQGDGDDGADEGEDGGEE